jgi:hypothetical protein
VTGQVPGLLGQLLLVAAADHEDFEVGERLDEGGQRPEQDGHPLARFVEAAQEQHRPARPGITVQDGGRGERVDVDAVGDFDGVGAERLHLPAPGQVGHRDAADDLLVPGPQDALKHAERQRLRGRRVERGDDRPLGDHQRQHRQARCVWLVNVQHVEVTVDEPPLHHAMGGGAESQPRHRSVVRNRDRLTAGDDVVGELRPR